jgi:hypothetical protein
MLRAVRAVLRSGKRERGVVFSPLRFRSPGLNNAVMHRLHKVSLVVIYQLTLVHCEGRSHGSRPRLVYQRSVNDEPIVVVIAIKSSYPGHCPRLSPATGALNGCGPLSVVSTYWSAESKPSGGKPVFGRLTGTTGGLGGGSTARLSSLESFSLRA